MAIWHRVLFSGPSTRLQVFRKTLSSRTSNDKNSSPLRASFTQRNIFGILLIQTEIRLYLMTNKANGIHLVPN